MMNTQTAYDIEPSAVMSLSADDILDVLARQTTASVTYALADGHMRTTREPYVLVDYALYLPSSPSLGAFVSNGGAAGYLGESRRPGGQSAQTVECEINELDGLTEWRYVWLRGCATLLQPTGGASERNSWRLGIERLRAVVPRFRDASVEALAFGNFGVVRLASLEPSGVRLTLEGGMIPM
ncbi:MAG TPA: hypothetical protein VFT29_08175 [Gemmatimonadaceae bacterium]|nr:hypothetical protein [Gemmatimonadaceae bacterium]